MSNQLKQQLWKNIAEQGAVMLGLTHNAEHSEPMQAHVDASKPKSLWFFTSKDNRAAPGGEAMLQFVSEDHKLFACMKGQLSTETNKAMIDKFWSSEIEAWYKDGKTDDTLLMIRFDMKNAEIWARDESVTGKLKLATGVTLQPSEVGEHTVV